MDDDARDGDELERRDDDPAGEPQPVAPPRDNPLLLGHEAAEAVLLQAYRSGRLPHAWLLSGPRGIGKATLAFRFARFLFAEGAASGGHADLLVVERSLDPKRKKLRSEIVVDDTRAIAGFLRLTPAEGGWRVVIVDGADMMNRNAANALLKILEEPPQKALLLLVSDNPGRLLPTIRSRCRILALKPLAEAEVREALARYRPDIAAGDRAVLAQLAEGSIGRGLDLAAAGGLGLYRSLVRLIEGLPALDGTALHALADRLARGDGEDAFRIFAELLPGWVARMVALATGGGEGERAALPGEAPTMRRLAGRRGLDQWVEVWENLNQLFALADSVNLDRKQVVLNAFFVLAEAAR